MQATITMIWSIKVQKLRVLLCSIQGLDSRPNRENHPVRLSAGNLHASGASSANQGSC
jgi:hypothetical protein